MKKYYIGKFLNVFLIAVLMLFLITGCGGQTITADESSENSNELTEETEKQFSIGFVTGLGGIGDESLTDMVYAGILEVQKTLGAKLDYAEPLSEADCGPLLTEFAQSGEYDLIVALAYENGVPMKDVAVLYPEQKFLIVDYEIADLPNVGSIMFSKAEQGFIPGIICGFLASADSVKVNGNEIPLDNSSNAIGCILGTDATNILESRVGLYAALKYMGIEANVLNGVIGSWTDAAKAQEIASSQFSQGANIIFQNAGNAGKGIFSAAKEENRFTMGWNIDQHRLDPEHILFSIVKSMGLVTRQWILDYAETGEFVSGVKEYGYEDGGFELVYSPLYEPSDEIRKAVEAAIIRLENGEFKIPRTMEELNSFNEHP